MLPGRVGNGTIVAMLIGPFAALGVIEAAYHQPRWWWWWPAGSLVLLATQRIRARTGSLRKSRHPDPELN